MDSAVAPSEVTVTSMFAMQFMMCAEDWAHSISTLGTMIPNLRRVSIDCLYERCWSTEKAKRRLGYEPVADQDAAIEKSVDWAAANV
jgi:sterol-4alpha-carboxylate 3-dehydrogenase (decarboxylating)